MNHVPAIALLILVLACGRPANRLEYGIEPPSDSRIVVHDRLAVRHGEVHTRREGLIQHVQVELVNDGASDEAVEYRWEWMDAEGFQLGDTISSWQPVVVAGKAHVLLTGAGPGPAAVNFRLYLRRPAR